MRPQSGLLLGLLLYTNVGPPAAEDLQVPGYAEITAPATGQVVSGIVTIEGTAAHPEFRRYDLAFAFPNDPTDTWFHIAEAVETAVHDSRLGVWDTSAITEGEYDLRLRVWTSSGEPLIAGVTRIRVSRAGPAPSATTAAGLGSATPDPTATVADQGPTPLPTHEAPPTPPARIGRSQIAFGLGAIAAITLLGAWAIYGRLRHGYQRGPGGRRSRRRLRTPGGPRR
ncbi:MAG: hypothetical protein WD906_04910 [Anaerolineales bacterium]